MTAHYYYLTLWAISPTRQKTMFEVKKKLPLSVFISHLNSALFVFKRQFVVVSKVILLKSNLSQQLTIIAYQNQQKYAMGHGRLSR
jgi:hypothetical protein